MTAPAPLQSFRARLTLRWTLAVGVLLGLVNVAVYAGASIYLHRWLDGHVRTIAATEAASSTDGATDVHLHESFFDQLEAGAFTEKIVQIFDEQGTLVLQSTGLGDGPPLLAPDVIRQGLAGQVPLADAEGLAKWHTRWILVAGSPEPTYAVPVNAADVAASVASLECHAAYLADLPGHPVPAEFIPEILAQGGQAAGVEHAVLFKAYDLGPGMRAEADTTESED